MTPARYLTWVPALGLALGLACASAHAEINLAAYRDLDDCDAAMNLYASDIDICHCYVNLAERERSWKQVVAHLQDRLVSEPDDPRLTYALGLTDASRGDQRAEQTLLQSADLFAKLGDPAGEVQSLLSLFFLMRSVSPEAADQALTRAEGVAETSGNTELRTFVLYHRGIQAADRADFVEATRIYATVEAEVFPVGHPVLQGMVLAATGWRAAWEGHRQEAIERLERGAAIFRRIGDYSREASLRYDVARTMRTAAARGEVTTQATEAALDRARQAAERGRNGSVELDLLRDDANRPNLTWDDRLARYRRVLDLARRLGRSDIESVFLRAMANGVVERDAGSHEEALGLANEAIEVAQRAALGPDTAYGYIARALLHRRWGERGPAVEDWERGLTEIESIRDRQKDEFVQARQTQEWAFTYYRLLAYVMEEAGGEASPEEIGRALRVAERLRARNWLESLDRAAASSVVPSELTKQRSSVLEDLAGVQRSLLQKDLDEANREQLLLRLSRLETEEVALRKRIALDDPRFASLRVPEYPSLADVQAALRPDETLLSFQIGPEDGVPAWLFVMTGSDARAFPLPAASKIKAAVTLFLGMLERRDGQESAAASALHEMLLKSAGVAFGPETRSLIIVPDGPLHQLPIDLLRDTPEGPPLAARYDVSIVPSVTAWYRWRGVSAAHGSLPVLALADPVLDDRAAVSPERTEALSSSGSGRLPRAREETANVSRVLRGGLVVEGAEASESFLKRAEPQRYELLHIAAHAVLDDEHPERSAILLTPGSQQEDGLLQLREIVGLDLRDRAVVLSACSSASGTVLQGAGMMGIARGFFHAGARAVVGSLYPLRDDEAARIIERFAAHLAAGSSMAEALARARREMAAEGAPAAAWSGLIVLGDGGLVPFPGGVGRRRSALIPVLGAAGLVAILLGLAIRRRRIARAG